MEHVDKLVKELGVQHGLTVYDGRAVRKLSFETADVGHDVFVRREKLESLYQDTILLASQEKTGVLCADVEQGGF